MNLIEIRNVSINDLETLQKISRQTFFETFSEDNTEENMSYYLQHNFSIKTLTIEIKNQNSHFYFAILDAKVIGYLKLNFGKSQTELKDECAIEIERIYVLKEFHGKHIGQALFNKTLQIAKHKSATYIWLGVWEKNTRAIHFYKKNGFIEFDKHIFKLGNDAQTDIMMKLNLADNT